MAKKTRQDEAVIQSVAIEKLIAHPNNRHFSLADERMTSLIESVKAKGIQMPLVVRPGHDGKLQVICGARRVHAAHQAKLKTVPVIVRDLDDKAAIEMLVCENLERENPNAVEEAIGIEALLSCGWDLDSVASRLGKSPKWVARRRQLNHLIPQFQELALKTDPPYSSIPVGVWERVARLPAQTQQTLYNDSYFADDPHVIGDWLVEEWIDVGKWDSRIGQQVLHSLKSAPWKLDDETLCPVAGACSSCMKRSGAQPLLFDDEPAGKKSPGDRCLDEACYRRKQCCALETKATELRAKHKNLIFLDDNRGLPADVKKIVGDNVVNAWKVERAKKSDPEAVPALIVDGSGFGTVRWVKRSGLVSPGRKERPKDAAGKPKPLTLKERRAGLEARRQAYAVDKLRERFCELRGSKEPFKPANILPGKLKLEGVTGAPLELIGQYRQLACLAVIFGTGCRLDSPADTRIDAFHGDPVLKRGKPITAFDQVRELAGKYKIGDVALFLYRQIIDVWVSRLARPNNELVGELMTEAEEIARVLQIDIDVLKAEAAEKIPEPKSWAHLNADGTPKQKKAKKTAAA